MRLFALLNFQHVMAYIFVGLLFLVMFGIGLAFAHFQTPDAQARKERIVERYAEGLVGRNAPFPLFMVLVIAGVIIWGLLYVFLHGAMGVQI